MFDSVVPLNKSNHAEKGARIYENYSFARAVTSAPLGLSELPKAARELPIVFTNNGPLVPVAQMGFRTDENQFIDDAGVWLGSYIPAHLRRFPFVLGEIGSDTDFKVMISEAGIVDKEDGVAFFCDDGVNENEIVLKAKSFLLNFHNEIQKAATLCAKLKEYDVLVERSLEVASRGKIQGHVTGVQVVDWSKVVELDNSILSEWVRIGLIEIIHMHLRSLSNNFPRI